MKQFSVKPEILMFDQCKDFAEAMQIGEKDLVITNDYIYNPYFGQLGLKCRVVLQEKYGMGEPTDEMAEALYADIKDFDYNRVIAIGGGTIIDLCKIFSLEKISPVTDLFDKKFPAVKNKKLYIVPTTCGTGSEVTNISILAFLKRGTKFGLADDALYADGAVLIPELLKGLPFKVFATSSIDALVHAVESGLSPKASPFTEMYSYEAIRMILSGYKKIEAEGPDARMALLGDFHTASTFAGIAFGNAGCAAVHAMAYPLGATYHVPHGESNYAIFTGVMKKYMEKAPVGRIQKMNAYIAGLLGCEVDVVYEELEKLLNNVLQKKPLRDYGVTEEDLKDFTENVMERQGRLMANNYTTLTAEDVYEIYKSLR